MRMERLQRKKLHHSNKIRTKQVQQEAILDQLIDFKLALETTPQWLNLYLRIDIGGQTMTKTKIMIKLISFGLKLKCIISWRLLCVSIPMLKLESKMNQYRVLLIPKQIRTLKLT